MSNGSLQSYSLAAFSCRGGQSVITHFCVDKLSELQISLFGELTSATTLILMRRAGNSHSFETSETMLLKLIPVMDAWLDKVLH